LGYNRRCSRPFSHTVRTIVQHTTITDEAAYARWRFEYERVNELLARIEETERALLISLRCPRDPVQIVAILEGKTPAPWPRRTAARDRKRAAHAMRVLLHISAVRRSIALGEENARLAAHQALLAGLYANSASVEAALGRKIRRKNTENAQHAREARRSDVVKRERDVRLESQRHRGSDRAIAAAVARKLNLNLNTVRSILRRKP
jgi:hypothetical protein